MSRLPFLILRCLGVGCLWFGLLGVKSSWFWLGGAVRLAEPDAPCFRPLLYAAMTFYLGCHVALIVSGLQLIRANARWVRLFIGVVILEMAIFLFGALLAADTPVGHSLDRAIFFAGVSIGWQLVTGFVIWGPLVAYWASRRIEAAGRAEDLYARQEHIARPSDWVWAGVSALLIYWLAEIALEAVPTWLLAGPGGYRRVVAMLIAIANAVASVRLRRRHRRRSVERLRQRRLDEGLCGRCEYDLTGNTSGVCPECGQQVAGE